VEQKWDRLTEREKQIVLSLAEGASNKEICLKLDIRGKTVETHLERIYQKLEVPSRAKAVVWAIKHVGDFPY
jgi:DNA-binding CsgD family transcriptional regulator